MMTERLKQAIEETAGVLPVNKQDELADALALIAHEEQALKEHAFNILLEAVDELRWDAILASSHDKLARMAQRARQAYEAGETKILDPNKL
jgi:phage/plasmid-associated DNA primase